LEIG